MTQQKRLAKILELLEKQTSISQEELMQLFDISKDTARRDIVKLVDKGIVERYPGGISQPLLKPKIDSFSERMVSNGPAKQAIASFAKTLIGQGETLYLDVSTTVNFLAADLADQQLLVVTNSIDNAVVTTKKGTSNQAYLLAGYFNPSSHVLAGESLLLQLREFEFDYAFIGAAGISSTGLYYSELSDVHVKKMLIDQSKKVCLLIDSSKQQARTAFKIDFEGIDMVVTDAILDEEVLSALTAANCQIMSVEEEK